jgi:hypothetical protein
LEVQKVRTIKFVPPSDMHAFSRWVLAENVKQQILIWKNGKKMALM